MAALKRSAPATRSVLEHIRGFVAKLDAEKTEMTAHNLGTIFAPALIYRPKAELLAFMKADTLAAGSVLTAVAPAPAPSTPVKTSPPTTPAAVEPEPEPQLQLQLPSAGDRSMAQDNQSPYPGRPGK